MPTSDTTSRTSCLKLRRVDAFLRRRDAHTGEHDTYFSAPSSPDYSQGSPRLGHTYRRRKSLHTLAPRLGACDSEHPRLFLHSSLPRRMSRSSSLTTQRGLLVKIRIRLALSRTRQKLSQSSTTTAPSVRHRRTVLTILLTPLATLWTTLAKRSTNWCATRASQVHQATKATTRGAEAAKRPT